MSKTQNDLIAEFCRANNLKEREVVALEQVALAQETIAEIADEKSKEGTAWEKFWYGGNGGAGRRTAHMRVNY